MCVYVSMAIGLERERDRTCRYVCVCVQARKCLCVLRCSCVSMCVRANIYTCTCLQKVEENGSSTTHAGASTKKNTN